jgi:hypothetical protein
MTVFPQPAYKFTAVSAAYQAAPGDYANVTTGAAVITVTLPSVSQGGVVQVRKVDSGSGSVKLVTADGSTIDGVAGATGISAAALHAGFTVACDGVSWWVVGQ